MTPAFSGNVGKFEKQMSTGMSLRRVFKKIQYDFVDFVENARVTVTLVTP